MRELTFVAPGHVEWREAPAPELGSPKAALVRPVAVANCDLDAWMMRGQTPHTGPFPLGHEFVAEVVEPGEQVTTVTRGQLVSVAFQIGCGSCRRCRIGQTGCCESVPRLAAYGMGETTGSWGGALSDLVGVPYADAMCLPLPDGVDPPAVASLSDNLPDAWRTVGPYLRNPYPHRGHPQSPQSPDGQDGPGGPDPHPDSAGDRRVLVFGHGSIGLYATAIARALDADVTYVDPDPGRCAIAEKLGAAIQQEQPQRGYPAHPIVVHTTATVDGLRSAIRSTDRRGVCTDTGVFYRTEPAFPLLRMYSQGITFATSTVDARAHMPAVLELIASHRLHPEVVTAATVPWPQAAQAWPSVEGKLVVVR
jgi:threonine dehydrogenase-like Zn-dependent dehydrogenase